MNSLDLDPRQRAMLQEMGVRLWWPAPAQPGAEAEPTRPPIARGTPAPAAQAALGAPPASPRPQSPPAMPTPPPAGADLPSGALMLQPPRVLYPGAPPQDTPPALGAGWLIVAEGVAGADPFAGDGGRLLGNMLRALQLHRHPRAYLCVLSAPTGAGTDAEPAAVLAAALAELKPSVLLLMGRAAARTVLGRTEPLGRLRGAPHAVQGVPAVVTYDAPYLLRVPDAKPGAWADLCLARSLAAPAR